MYALIGLSLVLLGVAGLQFTYLFHVDRLNKQRRAHLKRLERKCADLTRRVEFAERRVAELNDALGITDHNESWAEIIDER